MSYDDIIILYLSSLSVITIQGYYVSISYYYSRILCVDGRHRRLLRVDLRDVRLNY